MYLCVDGGFRERKTEEREKRKRMKNEAACLYQ